MTADKPDMRAAAIPDLVIGGGQPMACRLKCEKPGKIEYTLTITMKAEDWEQLRDQLDKLPYYEWPTSDLKRHITDLLGQARKIYWPSADTRDETGC